MSYQIKQIYFFLVSLNEENDVEILGTYRKTSLLDGGHCY